MTDVTICRDEYRQLQIREITQNHTGKEILAEICADLDIDVELSDNATVLVRDLAAVFVAIQETDQ